MFFLLPSHSLLKFYTEMRKTRICQEAPKLHCIVIWSTILLDFLINRLPHYLILSLGNRKGI